MNVPSREVLEDTMYILLFADYQVLITQKFEDMEFIVRKLLEKYEK